MQWQPIINVALHFATQNCSFAVSFAQVAFKITLIIKPERAADKTT